MRDEILEFGKETCTREEFRFYIESMRKFMGLTRGEFGFYLNVSPQTIRAWENGDRVPKDLYPVIDTIRYLAKTRKFEEE